MKIVYTNITLPNLERASSLLGSQALLYVAWPFISFFHFSLLGGYHLSELAGRPDQPSQQI